MKKNDLTYKMVQIGLLTAISMILYELSFNLPALFPSFLKIQFSNVPALIGGLSLGPIGGGVIVLIRFVIKCFTSETQFVGEIADLIIGMSTVMGSALIYRANKTKIGGRIALFTAFVLWVSVSAAANYLLIIPYFSERYGINTIIKMSPEYLNLTAENLRNKIVLFAIVPFNLLLASITCTITYVIYKRVSLFFKWLSSRR